jgi:hypothetical protein
VASSLALLLFSSAQAAGAVTVSPTAPPGTDDVQTIVNWLGWAASIAGVIGMIGVGIMMALAHRRGEGGEQMGKLGTVLGGMIVAAAAGPVITLIGL